ncbi:MAG: glycosyltransferase [Oligoflexus sp.]
METKTQQAAAFLKNGRYQEALAVYRLLSESIGGDSFKYNIQLCERQLRPGASPAVQADRKTRGDCKNQVIQSKTTQNLQDPIIETAKKLAAAPRLKIYSIPKRIAYIVSHGQSYACNGYAIRTQGVAKALNEHGFETLCFVRPGRPWELGVSLSDTQLEINYKGVRYIHSNWPTGSLPDNEKDRLEKSVELFMELFTIYRPEFVLAASNWIVGLPAWIAATRLGLPFYNEVRGFWELSRDACEPGYAESNAGRIELARDSFVAKQALKVFTLNQLMKDELGRRGVDVEDIKVVPNGVSERPRIKLADTALKEKLGIAVNEKVLGYIGGFNPYEGLDTLLNACTELVKSGALIKLLLVGDDKPAVGMAESDGVGKRPWLINVGRLPHEQIGDYYALIDILIIPRKKMAVCEIVPPMKAVEALAYGKRLVVSDLAALAEYACRNGTVVTFKAGSLPHLVHCLRDQLSALAPIAHPRIDYLMDIMPLSEEISSKKCKLVVWKNPLKRYRALRSPEAQIVIKDETSLDELKDVLIRAGGYFDIKQEVIPNSEYKFSVTCIATGDANPKGAVADITFYDNGGRILSKPYTGMASSKAFASYFYVETQNMIAAKPKTYTLISPREAASISISLLPFGVKSDITLVGDYKLIPAQELSKGKLNNSNFTENFNQILREAEAIPDSNGSEYFTKYEFRVGIISDIYMFNFYKDVFTEVFYLSPTNYQEVLKHNLDIIIYITCWKGINKDEWRGTKFREEPMKALDSILEYAKVNNIKTVFQSIEDPSNFEYFLPLAKKFEFVLTTDVDCIEAYKAELGHERVFFGEYGVNPQHNNPIGCRRNIRNAAFFAGSYPKRYSERCEDMGTIFDSIIDSGGELYIADRNFGTNSKDLAYPKRFRSKVLPPVQHSILQKLHKLFRYNLNFNSIKQSPTMCAMRVYELQAQGNGIISSYAKSVFNNFPGIRIVPFKQDMSSDFAENETWEEYRVKMSNIREVLNSKTSYQLVSTMLENLGIDHIEKENRTIAVICSQRTETVIRSFELQLYSKKILIEEAELMDWDRIKELHNVKYFCWFSKANTYEKHYLNDMLNGFKYTDSHYITKNAYFDASGRYVSGKEHEYTKLCSGKALSLFSATYLHPSQLSAYSEEQSFYYENGYSIDPYEMNFIRYMQRHTLNVDNYQLSVIVPVYNNGRFLVAKCLSSLQRNKIWSVMEILLVDDGSTDQETLHTLEYLDRIYPNIKVRFNHGKCSGSASRPRNQGIDMASAPLITFLDPDNEIAPGGYDLLMELFREANQSSDVPVEFISGFHVKVTNCVKVIGKHTTKRISVINDFNKGYFNSGRFPVIATQSAIISKEFLKSQNIRFVERSAGQDTLFGWELIARAKCGGFSNDVYIIYYADRFGSITNKVDEDYFEKKLILEEEQKKFLDENGLLDSFIGNQFDRFMEQWYLKKLECVEEKNIEKCKGILRKICSIYGKRLDDYILI